MTRSLRRNRQVEQDLANIYSYVYERSPQGAEKLLEGLLRAIRGLLDAPGAGTLYPTSDRELEGLRVTPARRYRSYVILFRATPTAVEVFRVFQGSQLLARMVDEIDIDFADDD